MGDSEGISTQMVHYQCGTCGITATMVITAASELAWLDHMATHAVPDNYRSWHWTVQQLFP